MAPRVFSEADFAPRVFSEADFEPVAPVNAAGNTYQEAMYGDAAPTAMKVASGALSGISSIADIPELLGNLAYKYMPMSPGFMKPTEAEMLIQIKEDLKNSGALEQADPSQVAALDAAINKANEPVLGLGDKVRSGFDYLTGIENSTRVAPDSYAHMAGSYLPFVTNPTGLLSKSAPAVIGKGLAQTGLVSGGGYVGREIDKAVGGSGLVGEIVGSAGASLLPKVFKSVAKSEVQNIENLLLDNDKTRSAKIIGGLDKNGEFTTKATDVVTQVTKKDTLAKELKDSGFWDNISATDGPSDVAKKLTIFKQASGETLSGLIDEAARIESGLSSGITKVSLKNAREYIKEVALSKPKLAETLTKELDEVVEAYYNGNATIKDLNRLRASWGETTKSSYNPMKTAEDRVRDTFNKAVYSDMREAIDRRAAELGAIKGDFKLADDLKAANRAYHASSGLETGASRVARGGVRARLNKDAFDAKNVIRMAGLAGASALGAPGAATYAALDFARAAARDALPVQTRAALKGASKIADIFDPLSRLSTAGVAGSRAVAGEGKYIATPGAKFTPKMLPPPEQLGIEWKPMMEGGVTGPSYPFKLNLGNIKDNLADMAGSGATDIPIFSLGKKTADPRIVSPKVAKKVDQLIEIPEGYRARTAEEIGSFKEEKARASQALEKIFHSDKKRYDVEIIKPSGKKLTAEEREAVLSTKKQPGKPILPIRNNRKLVSNESEPIEIFTIGKRSDPILVRATPKIKDPIPDNVQKSIDELKAEFDPETFDFEKEMPLDSENAWSDIKFQDGKYQSMLIRDNRGAVTKRVAWADKRPGYKANSHRVQALEALTKVTRDSKVDKSMASGKIFTKEMRDELINLETSQQGLSFRAVSDKTFMPADEATKKFLNLFERERINLDQLRATAVGVRTPIKVNGVDVSPYKTSEIPKDIKDYFDQVPLPENPEGGMTTGKAALALTAAGAIGMGVMNGGSLNEVALTPENKASERLVEAMIKQESSDNAKAVSPKGAQGLMQIMPGTAKEIAREMGLKKYDIYDPETNKKMGTHYINKMLKIFKNDPKLALAAYNAGSGNVRRWIAKWGMDWDKISSELEKRGQYMETVKYVPSIIKKMGVK